MTIPKGVRERLGLRPGDHLRFTVTKDGAIHAEPLDSRWSSRDVEDVERAIVASWAPSSSSRT